jgi:hypothetical protein
MPILNFTQADKMAAVTVDKGWHPSIISEWKSGPSKSGKSINHFITIQITDGKFKGKELKTLFNSEMNNAQVMGDLSMFPEHDILRLVAAINNVSLDEVKLEGVDTDTLLNRDFDVQYDIGTNNGLLFNTIVNFLPKGKGASSSF